VTHSDHCDDQLHKHQSFVSGLELSKCGPDRDVRLVHNASAQ